MMQPAKWITTHRALGDVCPLFQKAFVCRGKVAEAKLSITALGVYEAKINGQPVGDFVLAPGWTSYDHRLQVQSCDVGALLGEANSICVSVGRGWYASPMVGWTDNEENRRRYARPEGLIAELSIRYEDGRQEIIRTDESWQYTQSPIRFSELYDGEHYDANAVPGDPLPVSLLDLPHDMLIPQEGEKILERERIAAVRVFTAPNGERLVDFGQVITGYVSFSLNAKSGDVVRISHGEVLDAEGNFYNENYRSAKALIRYVCKDGPQRYHPIHTFFGFRYLRLDEFPGTPQKEMFEAVAVYSDIRQTGSLHSGHEKLNRLFSNIFWGQHGNFLDVPTDCPQRDERLGWTGDAQVFVKAASYNYDVERFFRKWLRDLSADQFENGGVPDIVPDYFKNGAASAAWGDAAVICPWQIYMSYGDEGVLREQFESMRRWVDYIGSVSTTEHLWTGGRHYGDWLGLDAPAGSYKGSSREDFIASAFYAHSAGLLVKAGEVIGEDVSGYRALREEIVSAFRRAYPEYRTQTEHILALHFELCEDPKNTADALARMIRDAGGRMQTGFVGTPYLLHALSGHGYTELAYSLLLREEYPSWLYSVNRGATTVWEHWDGIMEDGSFWSRDMNSFNHYAYGSVIDWVYEVAAGIRPLGAGFSQVMIAPRPDRRLGSLDVSLEARSGLIRSAWRYEGDEISYEITVPVAAQAVIGGKRLDLAAGDHSFRLPALQKA